MNWTCNDTRRWTRRSVTWPEEAIEHLASCELCQQVFDVATVGSEAGGATPLELEQLLVSTQQQLAGEHGVLAWLRSRPRSLQVALGVGVALVPVALQLVFAPREDLGVFPQGTLLGFVAVYGGAIVYAMTAILAPLYRPRSSANAWGAVLLAAMAPLLFITLSHEAGAGASFSVHDWQAAMACLRYGVFLAVPCVVILLAMDRAATRSRIVAWVVAALGGVVGNFVLMLHCANRESTHQLLGHASIGFALLGLLAVVGAAAKVGPMR